MLRDGVEMAEDGGDRFVREEERALGIGWNGERRRWGGTVGWGHGWMGSLFSRMCSARL